VSSLRPDAGTVGTTAIDKRAVVGPVRAGRYGLYADVQADRKHHGGESKALYAYADEDAQYWSAELGRDLPPGWFGENLRVEGIDVNAAREGERWQIGEDVIVEVTMPRSPCATFARWVGGADERGWVKRFGDAGRLGSYLRVVRFGAIEAGDPIVVVAVPDDAPTILEMFQSS
jgi:MOSC domain-containing protein YiiM